MRPQTSTITSMAAGAVAVLAAFSGLAAPRPADNRATAVPVDAELVIAVDVSNSMDPDEQELQREGYIAAFNSPEFLNALRSGMNGKIAVTYFEWAALHDQKIVVPWRLIDGPASAAAFTGEIARAPYRRAPRTSIYGALLFAKPLFDASGYAGIRRVIDVSGDGANNMGPPVTLARDQVVAEGIVINGLPIIMDRRFGPSTPNLDIYYEDCVIGGPGSFMIPIHEREHFKQATKTKLVLEMAGHTPEPRVMPAQVPRQRTFCY